MSISTPVQVIVLPEVEVFFTGVIEVAAGYDHSVALKDDGTVWTWGRNHYGQLGDGNSGIDQFMTFPVRVLGPTGEGFLSGTTAIEAGWVHSVALRNDGTVWTWGRNLYGQLGDGTNADSPLPVQVVSPDLIGEIGSGYQHTTALDGTHFAWTWGKNEYGQLGDGTEIDRNAPVRVKSPDGAGHMTGLIKITAGWDHTVALKYDGTVWTWGRNTSGQLGNGEVCQYVNRNLPVQVIAPKRLETEGS